MADIKFEIKETLGAIAESAKGWKKELNISLSYVPSTTL